MINGITTIKGVNGLPDAQKELIKAYLQGAVYCWCKNRMGEWFAARDLFGGENFFWQGTPLMALYQLYHNVDVADDAYAVEEAGKAVGRLLKEVLYEDKRTFDTREGYTREYLWTGDENNG